MDTLPTHATYRGCKRKIITTHVYPPIPIRQFDYCATLDGYDLGEPQGFGRTEEEAIRDLLIALED